MNTTWFVIRSSGLVAFGMLALSTIWGLVLSTGILKRSARTNTLTMVHEALAVGGVLATMVHMGFLMLDEYVSFSLEQVLVPGTASWRPWAVGIGIVAMYLMVLVTISFYVRARIGQRLWRLLHFAGFLVFAAALAHGVLAGTDTTHPAVVALYVATGTAVLGLSVVRVALARSAPSTRRAVRSADQPASAAAPEPAASR